jgi:hypothetical protein
MLRNPYWPLHAAQALKQPRLSRHSICALFNHEILPQRTVLQIPLRRSFLNIIPQVEEALREAESARDFAL